MDNKKIGDLIAKLRKEKGLTQQELGDKVGVGSRAVSKWECGTTIPDISIINELSEILGIQSDELLAGELKLENKLKKDSKLTTKIKIAIITIFILIITTIFLMIYYSNKTEVYYLNAVEHDKYNISGYITYKSNEAKVFINNFIFNSHELIHTEIKTFQYEIILNKQQILGYGLNDEDIGASSIYKINDIEMAMKNRNIENITISKEKLEKQRVHIYFHIVDMQYNTHTYDVELSIHKVKDKSKI